MTRAIGFTPEQVRRSIAWGDGLVGVIAAIAGIPLGTAMFLAVYRLVNGSTDLAALPPLCQLAAVPLATVAAVLAVVAIPARQASRASIIDGLAYE